AAHQHAQPVLALAHQFLDLGDLVAAARTLRAIILAAAGAAPGRLAAALRRLFAALAIVSAAPGALSCHASRASLDVCLVETGVFGRKIKPMRRVCPLLPPPPGGWACASSPVLRPGPDARRWRHRNRPWWRPCPWGWRPSGSSRPPRGQRRDRPAACRVP